MSEIEIASQAVVVVTFMPNGVRRIDSYGDGEAKHFGDLLVDLVNKRVDESQTKRKRRRND